MVVSLEHVLAAYGLSHWQGYWAVVHRWLQWGEAHIWTIVLGAGVVWVVMLILASQRRRPTLSSTTQPMTQGYGTAHLASKAEIRQANLHRAEGIFVGRAYGMDLRVPRSHIMIIGPSRCGKSWSMGFGTEAEWEGSVLTMDLKGEHIRQTSHLRAQRGNLVHIFEPRFRESGHINLLDLVPFGEEEEVSAIQRVTDHVTDTGATKTTDGAIFYRESKRRILGAVLLYEGNYKPYCASFARTRQAMASMDMMLDHMAETDHPIIHHVAKDLKKLRMDQRAPLWNSARDCLEVFDDPILARNTNDTTIDLSSLQHGESPQTVYIRVTPDDARGPLRSFLRLTLDQHVALVGQRRVVTDFRWHELVNFDDQFELGYIAAADHIESFYGEGGIFLMSTFQSFDQLGSYGKHASLLDNSRTWVIFQPNHTESAKIISQKLGKTTVQDTHVTRNKNGRSTTLVLHERDLMTTFEVEHIPGFHAFVFISDVAPILAQQIEFTKRELRCGTTYARQSGR